MNLLGRRNYKGWIEGMILGDWDDTMDLDLSTSNSHPILGLNDKKSAWVSISFKNVICYMSSLYSWQGNTGGTYHTFALSNTDCCSVPFSVVWSCKRNKVNCSRVEIKVTTFKHDEVPSKNVP